MGRESALFNIFIIMQNNFDLKKFLIENKVTTNSKRLNENENLLSILQDYINADYAADQGYDNKGEAIKERIEAEILKLKGEAYLKNLEIFASLNTYNDEYADSEESEKIEIRLQQLANKLGFTVDQLKGI